jgi:hypothetical protein
MPVGQAIITRSAVKGPAMRHVLFSSLCLMLVACGTPQEQCIARETRDLRVVNRLIAETEGNLARGYAFEEFTTFRTEYVQCGFLPDDGDPATEPRARLCLDRVPETDRRPVAIDLRAEQQKLDSLLAKRRDLELRATDVVAACKAAYPEG